MEHMLGIHSVAVHWGELPRREQQILTLRFYGDMTQAQIGHQLGISQMHVSRLRAHALGYLRSRLLDLEGTSAVNEPCVVAAGANRLCGRLAGMELASSGRATATWICAKNVMNDRADTSCTERPGTSNLLIAVPGPR